MRTQIDLFDEIIVDNFAGGGGASTGIELAAGRPVTIAINHDPAAILLHRTNHPYTEHLQASVWDVDPVEVCKGRPVGLAWFSPDCKHFSKAKGSALLDRNIRGLAWIVLRWAGTVRPRVIMLENVEEFQTWGPVRKGKPVRKKAGQTFRKWKSQLEELGYKVEHRELVAADYGAPTTRKRFVLVARCDGKPIIWPERTHAPRDSEEVRSGKLKPWRSAAEIIDWTLPGYSIFASKQEIWEKYGARAQRPLKPNTLRRIIRGIDKFTIKSGKPFIVPIGYGERKGQAPRVNDVADPVGTVVAKDKFGLCQPVVAPFIAQQKFSNPAQDIGKPLSTITSVGAHQLVEPMLAPITVTNTSNSVGSPAGDPVHTITTAGNQIMVVANLIQYHTEQSEKVRGQSMNDPVMTVDSSNRYGLASCNLVEYYGNGNPVSAPLSTVTVEPRHGAAVAHIVEFKGQDIGQQMDKPLRTITASWGEFAECRAVLTKAPENNLGYWPQIRELLNEYCGYTMADDEVILLIIRGVAYYISDITLRMLAPRELYNAMSFPPDYAIEYDFMGNVYPKNEQTAKCGNAVCPALAEAMVRANMPEWCSTTIVTMAQLHRTVAV